MSVGLRGEVLQLYRELLRAARHSRQAETTGKLVRESFRKDAAAVDKRDIAKVDWLLRRGWKQLDVLKTAAGASSRNG